MSSFLNETAKFFGVSSKEYDFDNTGNNSISENSSWQFKRLRHLEKSYGMNIKGRTQYQHLKEQNSIMENSHSSTTARNFGGGSNSVIYTRGSAINKFSNCGLFNESSTSGYSWLATPSSFDTLGENDTDDILVQDESSTLIRFGESFATPRRRRNRLPAYGFFNHSQRRGVEEHDYRPFFTYWITGVQFLLLIAIISIFGIGTDYRAIFDVVKRSGNVMGADLSLSRIVVWEQNNVWIGPDFASLVHAGAKYAPCMRFDKRIHEQIMAERLEEATTTGCCIRSNGCYQSSVCPKQFAVHHIWTNITKSERYSDPIRIVCGLDPRYCIKPNLEKKWSKDIREWPICTENRKTTLIGKKLNPHMHCNVVGRPCCIQMHGQCRITSREYCDFVKGYYHENASLCSQVNCLRDVCSDSPFFEPNHQFISRLITPLFLHAGIIRFLITAYIQLGIMARFEQMMGWHRIAVIYFVSGIGGYLASSIFVPYMPEVGPAGSQGGILGALIVDVFYNWDLLKSPRRIISIHFMIAIVLLLTGLIPYVDNWAQLFGFIFGILLAAALVPYINFFKKTRLHRLIIVCGSIGLCAVLFVILLIIFFVNPEWLQLDALRLFNCPSTGKICDHQSLILRSWLPI